MVRSLSKLIASTSELASLPSTTVRLLDLLDDATVDASAVLEIIEKDPSLTANLLKLCNSAYYGLRGRVGSVRQALVLLGNQTVLTLAFATSMGQILRSPLRAYGMEKHELWHHSVATALAAASLSADGGRERRERAFTAGLVHDIGKILLDRELGDQLVQLPQVASEEELLAAERAALGYDHASAGGALAEAWSFPEDLAAAVAYHHAPERAEHAADLVGNICAANLLALAAGLGAGVLQPPPDTLHQRLAELGLDAPTAHALAARLPRDLENLLSLLGCAP
jgi:putative nucleotidyltransferase with HDIG domain